jgi:hypothetical protein
MTSKIRTIHRRQKTGEKGTQTCLTGFNDLLRQAGFRGILKGVSPRLLRGKKFENNY